MNLIENVSEYLNSLTNIDSTYIYLIFVTILIILIASFVKKMGRKIIGQKDDARKEFIYNQTFQIIVSVVEYLIVFFIWIDYIKSIMTLISFISAAITIALKEVILNFFCGLYIKIKKPFRLEDRIEIDGIKGDVVSISYINFEILEVSDEVNGGQSTGIFVSFPNSILFLKPLKNYTKGFKYIWNELIVKVTLDSDVNEVKHELYKIVNNIDVVKAIPKKMRNQISSVATTYRVYFNKYEPVIYDKIVDDHVELQVRYLIHPKKARNVESIIWNKILTLYHDGKIKLYNKAS